MADYSNLSNAEKWRLINSSLDKVMAECDAFFRYRKDSERRKADRRARKDAEKPRRMKMDITAKNHCISKKLGSETKGAHQWHISGNHTDLIQKT